MPYSRNKRDKLKEAGYRLVSSGELSKAREIFTSICDNNKQDHDAHMALGIICGMLGDTTGSVKFLKKAIAIKPDHPGAYYNLGIAFKNTGNLEEAAACYKKAIRYDPGNATFYNNLGSILLELRDLDNSTKCFNKALELVPDNAEYNYNLGIACKTKGLRTAASKALEHAIFLQPEFVNARKDLGIVYISLGLLSAAENCFRHILGNNPNDEEATSGLASILTRKKEYTLALALLKPHLGKTTVSASIALAFSRISKRINKSNDAIKLLEQTLLDKNLNKNSIAQIHFSLGYFYDKKGEYEQAFEHFRLGNDIRKPPVEPDDKKEITSKLITSFSKESMKGYELADNTSGLPVFIVGMPRSGTSLVEQILASHPGIYGAGELDTLPTLLGSIPRRIGKEGVIPDILSGLDKTLLTDIANNYLEQIKLLSNNALRITDKMPDNFLNLGFIEMLFPNARIIHCQRNPLDTCLSCYFQDFDGHQYATSLKTLGDVYIQYERLMRHWKEVLNIRILDVCYEELVNNFEPTCKQMIAFCGIEWDKSCLDFHNHDRLVVTASLDQVNKPIYQNSIGRWKNYEAFIGELRKALTGNKKNNQQ